MSAPAKTKLGRCLLKPSGRSTLDQKTLALRPLRSVEIDPGRFEVAISAPVSTSGQRLLVVRPPQSHRRGRSTLTINVLQNTRSRMRNRLSFSSTRRPPCRSQRLRTMSERRVGSTVLKRPTSWLRLQDCTARFG